MSVYALALVPRRLEGLPGILSMPFVHGSFAVHCRFGSAGLRMVTVTCVAPI